MPEDIFIFVRFSDGIAVRALLAVWFVMRSVLFLHVHLALLMFTYLFMFIYALLICFCSFVSIHA